MSYKVTETESNYQVSATESYYQIAESTFAYEDEITAYIAGLSTSLNANHKLLLNTLVSDLKNGLSISSLSDAFDILYIIKNETEETRLRNLAQRDYDGTLHDGSGFDPFEGITGDGDLYVGTNFVINTDADAYKLNAGSAHIFAETLPQEDTYLFQAGQTETGGVLNFTPNRTTDTFISRSNTTTYASKGSGMDTLSAGMLSLNRNSSSNYFIYNNKVKTGDFERDSVGLPDVELFLLRNNTAYATNKITFFALGKSFTEAEIDTITDAYNTYSDAVDAVIAAETVTAGDLSTQSVSLPDMFNADVDYPQDGYETAMTWIFDAIATKGCDIFFVAGDLSNGRWGETVGIDITTQTNIYWAEYKARLDALAFDSYVGMGDHEYGDFGEDMTSNYSTMADIPEWRSQFRSIFQMPTGAPSPYDRLSYTVVRDNAVFIMLCPFEDQGGDAMVAGISSDHLAWLETELIKYADKKFKVVLGHVPVMTPSGGTGSSIVMADGVESDVWKMLVKHGVDLYDCGEWHNYLDLKEDSNILQITHGTHFGHDNTHSFLQCNVYENKMVINIYSYDIELTGSEVRPDVYENMDIVTPESSPVSAGSITIWDTSIGKYKEDRTGIFEL